MSSLFEFRLPDIGEGVAEGEVVAWTINAGDAIGEDQEMVEVMTDKATVPLTSPVRGIMKEIVAKAGDVVPVGAVLCRIEPAEGAHVPTIAAHGSGHAAPEKKDEPTKDEPEYETLTTEISSVTARPAAPKAKAAPAAAAQKPAAAKAQAPKAAAAKAQAPEAQDEEAEVETAEEAEPATPTTEAPTTEIAPEADAAPAAPEFQRPAGQRALAAPHTRRLAREADVDIEKIEGTGEAGRVTEEDVQKAAQAKKTPATPSAKPAQAKARAAAPSLSEQVAAPVAPKAPAAPKYVPAAIAAQPGRETRVPIRGLRKKISERMHQSKTTAAHFTYVDDVDVTELVELRGKMKDRAAKRGVKLTYLPFIAKAIVSALKEFPTLNGVTDDASQEFVIKHYYNFGIAVDAPDGLIVPVVKDVDKRSLLDLAAEMDRVASEAREGKSKLADLKDGTFTITNAGNIGGLFATPIINYPEAAIIGVHAIKKTPRVVDGKIEIRDVMYLSISIDHRMNDGATGARFMNHVISMLQDPQQLLLEM